MKRTAQVATLAAALAGGAARASAQTTVLPGRVEFGVGGLWIGAESLGTADANETTSTGAARRLFTATSTLAAAPALDVRAGVKVTPALEAEVSATYAQPQLRVQLSADTEGAASITATESLQQFTVGGGANWHFLPRRPSRIVPFIGGGGGYLRQLHTGATLAQTGQFYQAGGGVKVMLSSRIRKHLKGAGIRADARAFIRSKGVSFDGRRSASLALGASFFVRF